MSKKISYAAGGVLAFSLAYLVAAPRTEGQFFGQQPTEVTFPALPKSYGEVFQVDEWTNGETYELQGETYRESYRAVWSRDATGTVRRSVFQRDTTLDLDKSRTSLWKIVEVYPRKP